MWLVWSTTGGAGCTTVAAALALRAAGQGPTLAVDLTGDLPLVLGLAPPERGLAEWGAAPDPPPDALARLEVELGPNLALLPRGGCPVGGAPGLAWSPDRWRLLAAVLAAQGRPVVIDAGTILTGLTPALHQAAGRSWLVVRACYLASAQARHHPRPDGLVVVREPGRLLADHDLAAAWRAPVAASLRWDPSVAAAVDTGTLAQRLPRCLRPLDALIGPEPGKAT